MIWVFKCLIELCCVPRISHWSNIWDGPQKFELSRFYCTFWKAFSSLSILKLLLFYDRMTVLLFFLFFQGRYMLKWWASSTAANAAYIVALQILVWHLYLDLDYHHTLFFDMYRYFDSLCKSIQTKSQCFVAGKLYRVHMNFINLSIWIFSLFHN